MTFDSASPSSPKRPLPAMEASTSETIKKARVEELDDLAERIKQISKKDKKKYHRAKKLGQKADVVDGKLILQPKIHLRHQHGYASFNDVRNLILGTLLHDTKLPKGIEIHERQQVTKAVVVDIPILDPSFFEHDDNDLDVNLAITTTTTNGQCYDSMLSKSASPAHVYHRLSDPSLPYASFLGHLGIDLTNDDGCDDEHDAFGKVASGLCDKRKGLVDRFSQVLQCKLTKSQVKTLRHHANDDSNENMVSAEDLMLTRQDLLNENYPLHSSYFQSPQEVADGALPDGWIEIPTGQASVAKKKLLAMDCEMCRSGRRLVLTKVALVDEDHKVLLNEFVKPDCVITDYVTDYSGVDEASLKGVTTTLHDIQQRLVQYIDGDTILVGHGLVHDLRVLKMRHAHIIDTSVIYHHTNGPPYKASLKDLSTMILHRQIQQQPQPQPQPQQPHHHSQKHHHSKTSSSPVARGHDPCEDAIASMELVQLKMKRGLKFGLHADYLTELMVDRLAGNGKVGVMIDASSKEKDDTMLAKELQDHPHAYTAAGNQAAVALAIEHHAMNDLVLLKLTSDSPSEVMDQVQWLYDHLDPRTALIMLAGDFKTDELDRLRKKWYTYKADLKTRPLDEIPEHERWTELDEQRLDTMIELAKRYYIIPSIKL